MIPLERLSAAGTVRLTRIVRDHRFDVGLPLFVSRYPSRRSTPGRHAVGKVVECSPTVETPP